MKSLSCLILLSAQLVLYADTVYGLPHLKSVDNKVLQASMSRAYPTIKRENDSADQQWQKRTPPEHLGAVTSQQPKERKSEESMSKAEYHAKALSINAQQVGKELFHGPVRGVAEMPASGLFGASRGIGAACQSAGNCQFKEAGAHLLSGARRAAFGVAAAPVYLGMTGVINAVPPAGRVAKHFVGMSVHGVKQGFDQAVRGKATEKTVDGQKLLKDKLRPNLIRKQTGEIGRLLRAPPVEVDYYD